MPRRRRRRPTFRRGRGNVTRAKPPSDLSVSFLLTNGRRPLRLVKQSTFGGPAQDASFRNLKVYRRNFTGFGRPNRDAFFSHIRPIRK